MEDFDSNGGSNVIVHVLSHTSQCNSLQAINIVTRYLSIYLSIYLAI
jgi:hypothetical protein